MEALNFIIGLIIIGIILVAYATYLLIKWWESYLGKKRFNKGNIAERRAKKLLKKNGFKILEEQYPLKHQFKINMRQFLFSLLITTQVLCLSQTEKRNKKIEIKRLSLNVNFGTAYNIPTYLKIHQSGYDPITLLAKYATKGFESALDWMNKKDMSQHLPMFVRETRKYDKIRNENFTDVFPEWKDLFDKYEKN